MWFVNMQQPTLSIIVPIYNAEKYLSVCLDSIITANLELVEVLLINDGSTDGSAELCKEYGRKYPYIRYIDQANLGPSAARNRGLQAAFGEYIAFFDSDDYIASDAFCKTVSLLGRFPDAELWVSDFHRVADNGCVLDRVYQIDDTERPMEGRAYLCQFLKGRDCVWNVWRYIFRRDFLIRNSLCFIEGISCAEDLEFAVRALTRAKKPCFFHNPYYSYRVNYGDTLTRKYTAERMRQLMEMLQCSAKYLNGENSDPGELLLNKLSQEYLLNLSLLQEVPAAERPQAGRFLREAAWVAPLANRWDLKLFSHIVSLLGINAASQITYRMKRAKRRVRGLKATLYGKKMGAKAL